MNNQENQHEEWGAGEYALVGAGVGGAGVANSVGLIGVSAGLAALPFCIGAGLLGGLAWWVGKNVRKWY